jgi:serine protease Do
MFGVTFARLEETLAVHLGVQPQDGRLVAVVVPGSPAEKIGLQRNDVVLSVNGKSLSDYRAAADALRAGAKDAAAPVTIELIRAGKRLTLSR